MELRSLWNLSRKIPTSLDPICSLPTQWETSYTSLACIQSPGKYAIRCSVIHTVKPTGALEGEDNHNVVRVKVSDGTEECLVDIREVCLPLFADIKSMDELVSYLFHIHIHIHVKMMMMIIKMMMDRQKSWLRNDM